MKSVSVLVEYLIYISVSLFALSIILYYSYISSSNLQSKATSEEIINILNNLNNELSNLYYCYNCYTNFQSSLPSSAELFLYNNSNIISITYLSHLNCSVYIKDIPQDIIINANNFSSEYICNISLITYKYLLDQENITETNGICININKTNGILILSNC